MLEERDTLSRYQARPSYQRPARKCRVYLQSPGTAYRQEERPTGSHLTAFCQFRQAADLLACGAVKVVGNPLKTYLCLHDVLAITTGDVSWIASVIALSVGITFLLMFILGFRPRK